MTVPEPQVGPSAAEIHRMIREEVAPHFPSWAQCGSLEELQRDPAYRRLQPALRTILETPEGGSFSAGPAPARERYRIVAWNLERGTQLDGQLEAFRTHPYLRECDVVLVTEADVGMARSANRNVAQDLARELGWHYAFVPCYVNLAKGSGIERELPGENDLGLQGNAVLSRYPIGRVCAIPLENGNDKMAVPEKRLGCETALAAEIRLPKGSLTVASVHLDARSTQRHRSEQMQAVLDRMPATGPVVLGGDWNTTTYDSSRAVFAILGFWLRVLMGVDHVIRNHYLHPYSRFERDLFERLEAQGYDYRKCNLLGERTIAYDVDDVKTRESLGEWVPDWCFAFIRWSLRHHGGRCPFKIDWFATRSVRTGNPVVLHEFREGRQPPLSDHDPIGVDVVAPA